MERDISKLVSQMTLEEKAGLCSGLDFWRTKGIERLGIPSVMMTDGPHGLRKQGGDTDHLGLNKSIPATCFPSATGLACSWDKKLLEKVGKALGEECQAEDVAIILGPGANIKRSPLCGRNFEYFSEDPYLSSKMAASHIKGVQSKGVGTSLKHFVANNQEHKRMSVDTIVDERTLREIYLASFEETVKESKPWTVMCAYNKLNGEYCSENKRLLNDILKDEWGYEGFVVSDWGAVNERAKGIKAGLELEMPSSYGWGEKAIIEAIQAGELEEELLDKTVERFLKIVFKAVDSKQEKVTYSKEEHHQLAREVARESMVLLKNEENILPLSKDDSVAVIGAFAKNPRYQGGGSSHINPTKMDDIYEEIIKTAGNNTNISYAAGYNLASDEIGEGLIAEAQGIAKNSDVAVIFTGLPERYETEGKDREHLSLPENHLKLIEAVAEVQSKIVVVLSNGSPVEMPWIDKVKGLLEAYLGGQALGGAISDLLYGVTSPCGKLAETFPVKLGHNPSYLNFPGEGDRVEYKEGIFVGYRYYDTKEIEPLFPFGYGLSYTTFEFSDISVDKNEISEDETVTVSVKVKNTGNRAGKEIVQLYIKDIESTVVRPEKELKGFEKVLLEPGEEKTITFRLSKREFAYYNTEIRDWHVESGEFEILVGKSSREITLKETIKVNSSVTLNKKITRNSTLGELLEHPLGAPIAEQMLAKLKEFEDNSLGDSSFKEIIKGMVLRNMVMMGEGKFTYEMLDEIIDSVNQK